jgi:hypothetical protein
MLGDGARDGDGAIGSSGWEPLRYVTQARSP